MGPGRDTLWLGFKTARWLLCGEEAVSRPVGNGMAGRSAQGRQDVHKWTARLGSGNQRGPRTDGGTQAGVRGCVLAPV